ncbi:MAG: DUF4271 domain-containing protein [Breznakibacter sp.]
MRKGHNILTTEHRPTQQKMQNNQWITAPETTPIDTSQLQAAVPAEVWFSNERIAKDYIHAYHSSLADRNLDSDADSIQVVTAMDSLTGKLIDNIQLSPLQTVQHTEMPATMRSIPYLQQQKDWIFLIILAAFILIGSVRVGAPKFITGLFHAIFSETKWTKITESIKLQNRRASLQLSILYHLTIPLLVYEFVADQQVSILNHKNILLYFILLLAWLTLFGIRTAGYMILGYVFDTKQQTIQFLQASLIFTNLSGLLIFPISLLIPFIDPTYYQILFRLGLSIFIVLYIWHLSKGIKIILDDFLSIFYMFLYLCALEILPLIWLFKLFAG